MPQSILVKNIQTYEKDFDRNILQSAKNRLWNKRFGIGNKVNYSKDLHTLLYLDVFNTNNCELIEYINKTIKGETICDKKVESEGLIPVMEDCKQCTQTDLITDACLWDKIEW